MDAEEKEVYKRNIRRACADARWHGAQFKRTKTIRVSVETADWLQALAYQRRVTVSALADELLRSLRDKS